MAEGMEGITVVEDNSAPMYYYVCGSRSHYGGKRDFVTPSNAFIIPADKLVSIKNSVYDSIIVGNLNYNGVGQAAMNGAALDVAKEYLDANKNQYNATIEDGRRLFELFIRGVGIKIADNRELKSYIDNLLVQIGFVKVYAVLKEQEIEVKAFKPSVDVMNLDLAEKKYPGVKKKVADRIKNIFSPDDVMHRVAIAQKSAEKMLSAFDRAKISKSNDIVEENPQNPNVMDLIYECRKRIINMYPDIMEMDLDNGAVTKKRAIVIEDPKAKRQYMNAGSVTNSWWYSYRGIPVSEDSIIIPSDKLVSMNTRAYKFILKNDPIMDNNGNLIKKPDCGLWLSSSIKINNGEIGYVSDYIKTNYLRYQEVIEDCRDIIRAMFANIGLFFTKDKSIKEFNRIIDTFLIKTSFFNVYLAVKSNEYEIRSQHVQQSMDVDAVDERYPGVKKAILDVISEKFANVDFDEVEDNDIETGKSYQNIEKNYQNVMDLIHKCQDAIDKWKANITKKYPDVDFLLQSSKQPEGSNAIKKKEEILQEHLLLQEIEDKLGADFQFTYRNEDKFIYMDMHSTADSTKAVHMGIVVDLDGCVFDKTPKFWPVSDRNDEVDFIPAIKLTEETITAYWNRNGNIDPNFYCITSELAEWNRQMELKTVFDLVPSEEEAWCVIQKVKDMVTGNPELNKSLEGSRCVLTEYADADNFMLETPIGESAYCGGPKINKKNTCYIFCGDKVSKKEFFIPSDSTGTRLELERVPEFL